MIDTIRYFYWDMASQWGRYEYISALLRNIPGELGVFLRRKWYAKKFLKAGKNLNVYPGAIILNPKKIECGYGVNVGYYNYIQAGGGIVFGNNVLIGPYAKIWSQSHNYRNPATPVCEQGNTFKPVIIGDDVWIGANVFIMPGVVLGNRCVISASSVVGQKEYPEGTILAGYPARKIGERNYE